MTQVIQADQLPTASPFVVYRELPDGAVLFSTVEEVYFGLNPTGAFVWEHLAPVCNTVDEVCVEVGRRFPGAEPDRVRRDVSRLLAELTANRLVQAA
jgi:hypothetical protein